MSDTLAKVRKLFHKNEFISNQLFFRWIEQLKRRQRNREKIHRTEKRGKTKPGLNFFSVEMKVFVSDVTKETSKRGGRKKLPKFLVVPEASKMKTLLPDKLIRCKIRIGCSVRFLVADFGPKNRIECRGTRFVTSMKSNKAIGVRVTALSQIIKVVYHP